MKIAIWHNLPSGGAKRALYNHVKHLVSKGHYCEAWTTDMSDNSFLPLSDFIVEHRKPINKNYLNAWKEYSKNDIKREDAIIRIFNNHYRDCVREIELSGFDMIFANSCQISFMPYISNFTNLPKFVYLGEPKRLLYEACPANQWEAPWKRIGFTRHIKRFINDYRYNYSRRLKVLYEIEAARNFDRILVNSMFSRESVIRAYGVDANVCYLGIDTKHFSPIDSLHKDKYLVGLGEIAFNKSVHKAISIISAIPEKIRPQLKWIANAIDNNYFDYITGLAKELNVDFIPYIKIDDSELINILSKAALMIYTSHLEPFGLAPLEANSCGTYAIVIAEGGVRESINHGVNGSLMCGFLKDEWISEIIKFSENLEYATAKGTIARSYVQELWNEEKMFQNLSREIQLLQKERGFLR